MNTHIKQSEEATHYSTLFQAASLLLDVIVHVFQSIISFYQSPLPPMPTHGVLDFKSLYLKYLLTKIKNMIYTE